MDGVLLCDGRLDCAAASRTDSCEGGNFAVQLNANADVTAVAVFPKRDFRALRVRVLGSKQSKVSRATVFEIEA